MPEGAKGKILEMRFPESYIDEGNIHISLLG